MSAHTFLPRTWLVLSVTLLVSFSSARAPAAAQDGARPNIVFVMADDMGYGDVGCYNADSQIGTPHMDRLATEGVRFTDAHAPAAVCTPTRYAVLTGRYCWRTWMKRGVVGGYTPPLIEPERTTVASFLAGQGYRTACIGKWHLGVGWTRQNGTVGTWKNAREWFNGSWQDGDPAKGMNVDFSKPIRGGPRDLGFDYAYFTAACSTIDGPFCFIENRRTVGIPSEPIPVDRAKHPDFRPRRGWMVPGFDIETVDPTFTRQAIAFMERSRREHPDQPFFVYLALSSPHAPWLPPPDMRGATAEGPRGDLVALADRCVGEIVAALDRLRLRDNTLLIVTSDNGPRHGGYNHRSAGKLRGHKSHIWEGGHRVPFLARWPGHTKAGTTSDEPIELTDLMATCAAIVGAELPDGAGPDSYNVLPALLAEKRDRPIRQAIVSHSVFGVFAIRQGPWKLIVGTETSGGWVHPRGKAPTEGGRGQLYLLDYRDAEPYEGANRFEREPQIVKHLTALLEKYKRAGRSTGIEHPPLPSTR